MKSTIEWEHDGNPVDRGAYTVLLDENGKMRIKTAHWSPSSGLWFCECGCVKPEAWAKRIVHE